MDNIKLSKRLYTVATMVTKTDTVADIGCDHAHTAIFLIKNGYAKRVIAMDINKGPVERAKENVKLYNCEEYIDIRLSDGAKELKLNEADTILISGMGGRLMEKILMESLEKVLKCRELILQPQSELSLVRKFLYKYGFIIEKEDMLIDDNKYYVVIKAINNNKTANELENISDNIHDKCELEFGKYLLENNNKILLEFLKLQNYKYEKVFKDLTFRINEIDKIKTDELSEKDKEKRISYKERLVIVKEKLEIIGKGLKYYEM